MALVSDALLQELAADLRRVQSGDVRFGTADRLLYAGDASHHRVVPHGVVLPRTADDVAAVAATCAARGVPMVPRGAGTSLAGNAINRAVVVDTSRLRDSTVDVGARTATVAPGVVLSDLLAATTPHGLAFGPDPSTANRCTFGGMVGNNACGTHSLTAGRTADNVLALRGVLADGATFDTADGVDALPFAGELRRLGAEVADEVARRQPPIPRRVSGYNLGDLHPDRFDLARFLVGSEGTLAMVTRATVRLVDWHPHRAIVAIGHPDPATAADHVPALLAATERLVGLEGIDRRVVDGARHRGAAGTALLPDVDAAAGNPTWLLAEFDGTTPAEAEAAARRCLAALQREAIPATLVADPVAQAALWLVRKAGLGAVTFVPGEPAKVGGWEDAAVDPARLGDYLRGFHELAEAMGFTVATYGHFGDGCVHTKIGVDHATPEGVAAFRAFVEAAADLTVAHGGSLSGEHGDGRSRSELLGRMLGPDLLAAQRHAKALFDPTGLLNPGIVVDPAPLDGDLRMAGTRVGALVAGKVPVGLAPERTPLPTWFRWLDDAGDMAVAANRCIGMGVCRRDDGHGTMCPTWRVTGEERHSTRGRARLLQEAMRADTRPGPSGEGLDLDAPEVAEALDLCLACKGCLTDCPVDVDLPSLKAEFNAWRWRGPRRGGARRPLLQTLFGHTPRLLRAASRRRSTASAANAAAIWARSSTTGRAALRRLGLSLERPLPPVAEESFLAWWDRRRHEGRSPLSPTRARGAAGVSATGAIEVVLFADTFSDVLAPAALREAVEVLEASGHRVLVAEPSRGAPLCCGRPAVDPGMLDLASRQLRRSVDALLPHVRAGRRVVFVEASCLSALVDEGPKLLGTSEAREVAAGCTTLAEVLAEAAASGRWTPPSLAGREVVLHGHCHQHATVRTSGEARLLDAMGASMRDLDAGCCGLAGAYGFEAGAKHATSVAIAETRWLPAIAAVPDDALLVADGWSCRTQLDHLGPNVPGADRRPWRLASLVLAAAAAAPADVPAQPPGPEPAP